MEMANCDKEHGRDEEYEEQSYRVGEETPRQPAFSMTHRTVVLDGHVEATMPWLLLTTETARTKGELYTSKWTLGMMEARLEE